jgi:hypothetical protein
VLTRFFLCETALAAKLELAFFAAAGVLCIPSFS